VRACIRVHARARLCTQNFIALIPLALLLGDVTEDLAARFGDVVGGLLNATFGNVGPQPHPWGAGRSAGSGSGGC